MILLLPSVPIVGSILSRPYKGDIPDFREKEDSIERLSKIIHEVNPDYLLFLPVINSIQSVLLLGSYGFLWLFGQQLFFFFVVLYGFFSEDHDPMIIVGLFVLFLFLILAGFLPFLAVRQIKKKRSHYNKILLLKSTQQIAYYEHKIPTKEQTEWN